MQLTHNIIQTNYLKKSISILLAVAVFFTCAIFTTVEANAASPGALKTTTYEVIKKGNTVYCATGAGIYKVKIKNKKAVSKKCLVKVKLYDNRVPGRMKLKGGYLYCTFLYPVGEYMCRIDLKTDKEEELFVPGEGLFKDSMGVSVLAYAFKGKKLYTKIEYDNGTLDDYQTGTFVSKLNGKSLKKAKVKIKYKSNHSNAKGYKVIEKYTRGSNSVREYLKTPKGTIFLGRMWLYE